VDKITFKNSQGLNLVGILHVPSLATERAVIVCPGFTSNKDLVRHERLGQALAAEGVALLRIDFGGTGESDKREITVAGEVDDLKSAMKYLRSRGYNRLGFLGESLGGLVCLEAYDENIVAMVLLAPVTRNRPSLTLSAEQEQALESNGYFILKNGRGDFTIPKSYIDERNNVDRQKLLSRIKIPVLIVHGLADDIIPISDSEEAVELLPKGSRLEKIAGWEHGHDKMEAHIDIILPKIVAWFRKHFEG
jgi:pimeloyl-ACP methyl ester carboxylesterase